jgi:hypothetical protein
MAYCRVAGKIPDVLCFAHLRAFRYGRVFPFYSTTKEMKDFVKTPTSQSLRRAVDAHRREVKRAKTASNPVYLLYSFVLGWGALRAVRLAGVFLILLAFCPRLLRRQFRPDIWSSNIPARDGIALPGRPGTCLRYLHSRAIGGHYTIGEDEIRINFVSRRPGFDHAAFARHLRAALEEVIALGRAATTD